MYLTFSSVGINRENPCMPSRGDSMIFIILYR
jgi:hypothetical protein